jgi:glutamate-1-semialdehyde 2,1-aminomutase
VAAVGRQLELGTAISFPTEHEIRLAELVVDRSASVERVRFTNSGSEAVMLAIQAARAFTGRRQIARFEGCYHGSYDHGDALYMPFNDLETVARALREHRETLAAVVVDPPPHRPGFLDPVDDFLPRLRAITRELGVLLISDEVISFRLDYHGPQSVYGYDADLTTMGKIIGGGFPVGAFGGRADVMAQFDPAAEEHLTHGGTFNGNPVTMIAGYEAMTMLTPAAFARLETLGARLRTGLADAIETRGVSWQVSGQGSLFRLHPHPRPLRDYRFTELTRSEVQVATRMYLALLGRGFIVTPDLAGALSTPMTEPDIDDLVTAVDSVFAAGFA